MARPRSTSRPNTCTSDVQPDRAPAQRWAGTALATEMMRIVCVTTAHFADDLRSIWRSAHPEKRYGSLADLTDSMYCQTPTAQTTAGARWVKFTAVMHAIKGLFRIGVKLEYPALAVRQRTLLHGAFSHTERRQRQPAVLSVRACVASHEHGR